MKTIDIMRRAGRNLRQAKGRTFLTSLAIAVGAFTLTLSLAAGEGARQYADNLLKNNIDPRALFIVKDSKITSTSASSNLQEYSDDLATTGATGGGVAIKMMTGEDIAKLEKRNDIEQVIPIYQLQAKYVTFEGIGKKYSAPITYYDSSTLAGTTAGNVPKLGDQIADNEILVPQEFVDTLNIQAKDLVGKKVTVTVTQATATPTTDEITQAFMTGGNQAVKDLIKPQSKDFVYTVRGVIKASAMAITSNPRLHVSTNAAKDINDYANAGSIDGNKFFGVTALSKNGKDPASVKDSIQRDYGYTVQTAKDAQSLLFTFVNILQGIVAGFAMLALVASVFGIINTQYISVLERTSQIGLMKALGMRRRDIAKLFRYEAAWIGFIGGSLGVGLGLLVGWVSNPPITKALDLGENSLLIFVWWQLAALIIALIIIAIFAGWLPARKAARLDPIEALRTE
ncbi:MAG: ABC transporter permease [Candidatus Saccharimonas sp.]